MEEINTYNVRMQKEGQVLGYKSLRTVNLNENQNSKSLESTNWGKEKKSPNAHFLPELTTDVQMD